MPCSLAVTARHVEEERMRECCRRAECTSDGEMARRGKFSRVVAIMSVSLILLGHAVPASGLRGPMAAWTLSSPGLLSASGGVNICQRNSFGGRICRTESPRAGRSLLRASASTSASDDEDGIKSGTAPGDVVMEDGDAEEDDSKLSMVKKGAIASVLDRQYDGEIVKMAIPSYTSMLLDPIASTIDTSFLGRSASGALCLAGVGIANSILNYFGFTFFFLVVTTTTTVAKELAESAYRTTKSKSTGFRTSAPNPSLTETIERARAAGGEPEGISRFNADEEALAVKRRCSKVIGNAIFIALCLGTLSALSLYIFGGYLVTVIASNKSAAAFPFACEYIRIKALTIPMLLVTFSLSGAYRGYKDLMRPLLASTTATLVKMLMDYIFLVVYKMGVSGAAWSDVVSKGTSVSILLFFLVRDQRLFLTDILNIPTRAMTKDLMAPGAVLTARKIIEQLSFTATTGLSTKFGPVATAGMQIVRQAWITCAVMWWPLSIAGQTLVAAALAEFQVDQKASKLRRVRGIASRVAFLGLCMGLAGGLGLWQGSKSIPKLLSNDPVVMEFAAVQLRSLSFVLPFCALSDMMESTLTASRDYNAVLTGMLLGSIALFLTIHICEGYLAMGIVSVWTSLGAFMASRAATAFYRFNSKGSKIPKQA